MATWQELIDILRSDIDDDGNLNQIYSDLKLTGFLSRALKEVNNDLKSTSKEDYILLESYKDTYNLPSDFINYLTFFDLKRQDEITSGSFNRELRKSIGFPNHFLTDEKRRKIYFDYTPGLTETPYFTIKTADLTAGYIEVLGESEVGTGTITAVTTAVTGTNTTFTDYEVGDLLIVTSTVGVILTITDDTHIVLAAATLTASTSAFTHVAQTFAGWFDPNIIKVTSISLGTEYMRISYVEEDSTTYTPVVVKKLWISERDVSGSGQLAFVTPWVQRVDLVNRR
jgi:hypothetical protein